MLHMRTEVNVFRAADLQLALSLFMQQLCSVQGAIFAKFLLDTDSALRKAGKTRECWQHTARPETTGFKEGDVHVLLRCTGRRPVASRLRGSAAAPCLRDQVYHALDLVQGNDCWTASISSLLTSQK